MKTRVIAGLVVAAAAGVAILVIATSGGASATTVGSQLAKVRTATSSYHRVQAGSALDS